MTKKLEELFDLPSMDEPKPVEPEIANEIKHTIQEIEDEITISEKINNALKEVRGMDVHDSEMDSIAAEAMDSYERLMSLGMNMTDMAAGPVLNNAATMLKIALEAKDSKVSRKLKQIDLMLKKARLDKDHGEVHTSATTLDRNEILKQLKQNRDK